MSFHSLDWPVPIEMAEIVIAEKARSDSDPFVDKQVISSSNTEGHRDFFPSL